MSYYWFNRENLLKSMKSVIIKEEIKKAGEYYKDNKEAIKEKTRNKYKHLTEEENELKGSIQK